MSKLVFNIETASSSKIRALSSHCADRSPDGYSAIDLTRSHLNELLYGEASTLFGSLEAWYSRTGSKRPAKQAESPYFTIVMSASPDFFLSPVTQQAFMLRSLEWLKEEFGDDLVFAELHLDETTPHIHAAVAPTYEKTARIPGRQKKGESPEAFQARKTAAKNSERIRTVGRSSSKWAYEDSFDDLRKSATSALADLGITYGEVLRTGSKGQTTRDWIKNMTSRIRRSWSVVFLREKAVDQKYVEINEMIAQINGRTRDLKQKSAHLDKRERQIDADLANLDSASSEFFLLTMQVQRLQTKLHSAYFVLRQALPWASMKPEAKVGSEAALADLAVLLKGSEPDLKELSKRAAEVHDDVQGQPKMRMR